MLCTASPKTVRKAFADRRNNPHSVEACYDPLKYKISFADLQTFWRCRPMSAEVQIRNESRFGQHAWSRWECHGIRVSAPMPLADSASPASPGPLCRFWTPNVGRCRPISAEVRQKISFRAGCMVALVVPRYRGMRSNAPSRFQVASAIGADLSFQYRVRMHFWAKLGPKFHQPAFLAFF